MISREVEIAHILFNIPTLVMETIASGCGMCRSVDLRRDQLSKGTEVAGAVSSLVAYEADYKIPMCSSTRYSYKEYYLGSKKNLNKEKCADVMGVSAYDFAEGY